MKIDEKRPDKILKRVKIGKTNIDNLLESTKKYYDVNADYYEKFYDEGIRAADPKYREGYEKVEKIISTIVKPNELVLDVGCGVGKWSVLMAQKGAIVVSVDQSTKMLQKCLKCATLNRVSSSIIPLQIDVLKLPFLDNYFDGVTLNWILAHIPVSKNEDFIKRIARVVKLKGWLILSDSFWRNQEGGKEQLQIRDVSGKKFKIYKYYYEPEELKELIEKNFGRIKSMETTSHEIICVAYKHKK
jgi:ubiquinone/menaquinone biosynthesis C-methylase UbiE